MTRTEATFVRLLTSLEEFAAQESLQLASGQFSVVREIQDRAGPVVDELVRLGPSAIPAGVHARLVNVVNRRLQNQESLERQVCQLRRALGQTEANLNRIGQIAPVYGRQAKAVGVGAVA